jgi:hypothetical protein
MGMLAADGAAGPLPFCRDISIGFIARDWDVNQKRIQPEKHYYEECGEH